MRAAPPIFLSVFPIVTAMYVSLCTPDVRPKQGGVNPGMVVRDLGATLGETGRVAPARNDVDVYTRSRFITGVARDVVLFDYHGFHQELMHHRISIGDVGWACSLLSGLSEQQWQDAFRAGGYDRDVAARFIGALHSRIAQGRQIAGNDWPEP